jgi:ribosomal protein S18 acetylase RimI-like enzyme
MLLTAPDRLQAIDTSAVVRLDRADLSALEKLLYDGNPGHWFDPWLLETNQYFGIYRESDLGVDLVAVAGIHTYSPAFGVAALGNIVTHPAWRGQGLAKQVTAALCQSLLEHVPNIGLNVRADNAVAIHVYEQIGFSIEGEYEEFMLTAR